MTFSFFSLRHSTFPPIPYGIVLVIAEEADCVKANWINSADKLFVRGILKAKASNELVYNLMGVKPRCRDHKII